MDIDAVWNTIQVYTIYISFHFVSVFPFIIMELAWQQMNANEQNDFRIVSVNLNY